MRWIAAMKFNPVKMEEKPARNAAAEIAFAAFVAPFPG